MTNIKLIPLSFVPFASIIETDGERLNERLSVEVYPEPEEPEDDVNDTPDDTEGDENNV